MTRTTSARVAGLAQLTYMAAGLANEILMGGALKAEGTAAQLARVAAHATDVRVSILLTLIECFSALVMAVALYAITRDEAVELATLALVCRAAEGVLLAIAIPGDLQLLWLAGAPGAAGAPDVATIHALGAFLMVPGGHASAIFFAVGSTIFSYLLLRGRTIPGSLAWLGVISSALLVVGLPLQAAGFFSGPLTGYQWLPATLFAVVLGLWLLVKGVNETARR